MKYTNLFIVFLSCIWLSQVSADELQSSVAKSEVLKAPKTSRYFGQWYNYSVVPTQVTTSENLLSSYNWVALGYKLKDDQDISGHFAFNVDWTTDKKRIQNNVTGNSQDAFVQFVDKDVTTLPGEFKLYARNRLYLPTSTLSKTQNLVAAYGGKFIGSKTFNSQWGMDIIAAPTIYHHSARSYLDESSTENANLRYSLAYSFEGYRNLPKEWAIRQCVGGQANWYHDVSNQFDREHKLSVSTALEKSFGTQAEIAMALTYEYPMLNQTGPLALYNGKDTIFEFVAAVKF